MQDQTRVLTPTEYTIEIWDWKTNTYVADISHIVTDDGLTINWKLNDVESVDFSIDLVQFEKKCAKMGVTPADVLTPYVHDLRIRRNGEYIIGVQVVETNITIPNDGNPTIDIRCTGFLNLFKDRYVSLPLGNYTYAEMAQKLIEDTQIGDCLNKNPTIDIDASYWIPVGGTCSIRTEPANRIIAGRGSLNCSRSGAGWIVVATKLYNTDSGTRIHIDAYVLGQTGKTFYVRERQYASTSSTQMTVYSDTFTGGDTFNHIEVDYTTRWENSYIIFEYKADSGYGMWLDECFIRRNDDSATLNTFNVGLGIDTASAQQSKQSRNYSLQNIKDAIMELTTQESDMFDFDFSPDRTFNCYNIKGEDKPDIECTYPGNIHSMTIERSAANLANKLTNIGSGIGDERIEVTRTHQGSREKYGTRESIITNSNVDSQQALSQNAIGYVWDAKEPTDLPKIVIRDGSINPSNVQVGDTLTVRVDDDNYLATVNGYYRVVEMNVEIDQESVETVSLTLEPPVERPQPYYIRYIKDTLNGSNVNNGNHWVEIQALQADGTTYKNIALGKTVTCDATGDNLGRVTDGNTSSDSNSFAQVTPNGQKHSVIVDLGGLYPIDYIRVWHYYADNRTYHENTLSVGKTLTTGNTPLEKTLWDYPSGTGYKEDSSGRKSEWLQEGTNNGAV